MIQSFFLDLVNKLFELLQNKLNVLTKKSFLIENIDFLMLIFCGLTLFASTFMQSEKLGILALVTVILYTINLICKKGEKFQIAQFDIALIIYFVICFISTFNSTLISQSIHGFLKTVIYIFYYFCVANYFQTHQHKIKYILILVSCCCCFESVIALLQNIGGVEQIATWQDSNYVNPEDTIARAYGTLKPYNPNLLGGYLIAGLPFCIALSGLMLAQRKIKNFYLSFSVCLICCAAIFVTGSRGAYLGLGGIFAGLVILTTLIIRTDFATNQQLKNLWRKFLTTIVSIFTLILIFVPKITKRILSMFMLRGDSSTSFRMNVYNSSWQMFCDNWILGIGAGNQTFREIYGLYMLTGFDALSTYSVPLEIAVEAGIFALIAFLIFLGIFIYKGYKCITNRYTNVNLSDKVIICASILIIMGVMTHGLFDTIYFRPQVQFLFWTMIAMASGVIGKYRQHNKKEV